MGPSTGYIIIFHPKKSIHSTSSEQNHTYTIKQKLLDSPIMKQWERPHSYNVHFKKQMGQWREAVGQLPSQQPNQSCGTVAILTAWERDLNTEEGRTQYMKISEKVSGPVTCVKVMSAPRVILSAYIQENMPQSDPFICCGISCRTEKADPSWKWLELVLIQSWHRVVHTSGSVCPRSWPGHGYFYTQG